MQSLEEQSFYADDTVNTPTFDSIIADANAAAAAAEPGDFEDGLEAAPDPSLSSGAGAARMENDEKTGGVQQKVIATIQVLHLARWAARRAHTPLITIRVDEELGPRQCHC